MALGATVVIAEIDHPAGRLVDSRLAASCSPDPVAVVPTDARDQARAERPVADVSDRFGKIDFVVNNVSVAPVGSPVWGVAIGDGDRATLVPVLRC